MKTLVTLLSLSFAACASAPVEDPRSNEALVAKMFEAFNQHNWTEMAGFYSAEANFLDPAFGIEYFKRSRPQIIAHYSNMEQRFPDIHDEVVNLIASGDKVVAEFISSGTAPDGTKWKLPICTVFTVRGGKIVRDATYYDPF